MLKGPKFLFRVTSLAKQSHQGMQHSDLCEVQAVLLASKCGRVVFYIHHNNPSVTVISLNEKGAGKGLLSLNSSFPSRQDKNVCTQVCSAQLRSPNYYVWVLPHAVTFFVRLQ